MRKVKLVHEFPVQGQMKYFQLLKPPAKKTNLSTSDSLQNQQGQINDLLKQMDEIGTLFISLHPA